MTATQDAIAALQSENARLRAELERAKVDAERYRWLRDEAGDEWEVTLEEPGDKCWLLRTSGWLDEKIDAARGKG